MALDRPVSRIGRPPKPDAARCSHKLTVRMPGSEFNRARQLAEARGVSLPAIVRAGLRRWTDAQLAAAVSAPARVEPV